MIAVASTRELADHVGTVLGHSEWMQVTAERLAEFGSVTGDEHWMHVDRARARAEGPFGDVIAHGFLLLSLVTGLANQCYSVQDAQRWTNYGLDRVRFTSPVTPSDHLRLALTLKQLDESPGAFRLVLGCVLELRDSSRPALVADWIVLITTGEAR